MIHIAVLYTLNKMSYNFIYIINNKTSSSELYKSLEECYLAQNKFIGSKEIVGSVNSVQVQSCSNYNDEDAAAAPIYNFNANASPNTVQKLDSVPGAVSYTMLEPINGNNKIDATDTSFSTYIQSTFNIIIGVLIVIGVFRIMYGGTIFLTTDVIMGKMKGKEVIIGSLKGVILALFTWSILSLINPDILNNNISKVVGGGVGGVFNSVSSVVTGKIDSQ